MYFAAIDPKWNKTANITKSMFAILVKCAIFFSFFFVHRNKQFYFIVVVMVYTVSDSARVIIEKNCFNTIK